MTDALYNDGTWRITRETASLPDGRSKTTERCYRSDVSSILAFPTSKTLLLLREYRAFDGCWVWMLPSGHVDKESDPLQAAERATGRNGIQSEEDFSLLFGEAFGDVRINESFLHCL